MNPAREETFSHEGVVISIPGLEKKIGVRKETGKKLEDYPRGEGDIFQLQRLVLVFDLYDLDNPSEASGVLSAPVTVRVRYTASDAAAAGGQEKLRLGYYKNGHWSYFTKETHKFAIEPDAGNPNQGAGVVQLTVWGDPVIGWGH